MTVMDGKETTLRLTNHDEFHHFISILKRNTSFPLTTERFTIKKIH